MCDRAGKPIILRVVPGPSRRGPLYFALTYVISISFTFVGCERIQTYAPIRGDPVHADTTELIREITLTLVRLCVR